MYIADGGPGRTFFPISRGHESKRLKGWHGWSGRAHGIAECFPGERLKQQIHGDILVSSILDHRRFLYIYRMEYLGILLLSHGQKLEIKEYLRNFGFQFPVASGIISPATGIIAVSMQPSRPYLLQLYVVVCGAVGNSTTAMM